MKPRSHEFLFGRVVQTDAVALPAAPGAILIYVHNAWSGRPEAVPDLWPDDLLIPPTMVNRLGWSRGYFETVAHEPLGDDDVLPVHCFASTIYASGPHYFDEFHNELPGPVEPVGEAGLANYRVVDDLVSDALGVERAPS